MFIERQITIDGSLSAPATVRGPRLMSGDRQTLKLCGFDLHRVIRKPGRPGVILEYRSDRQIAEVFYGFTRCNAN